MKKNSYTAWQTIAEIFSAIILIGTLAALIFYWPQIADKIPSHYNDAGQPDAWSNKNMLITLAIVQAVLFIGITVLSLFPKIWNMPTAVSETGKQFMILKTRTMICNMKLLLTVGFSYILLCSAAGKQLSGWFLVLMIITVIGNMIYYFVKTVQISLQDARQAIKQDSEK
ncbi:MAG: DUF1648 domain-containing protein [Clostridiales bacterium]|nr:DUF1648 domain-containing protein [Clostridiales bacterium]